MPHYEFFCHACKKTFSKILTVAEHEKEKNICPHCGSKNVEQRWSAFSAITAKKSAQHVLQGGAYAVCQLPIRLPPDRSQHL